MDVDQLVSCFENVSISDAMKRQKRLTAPEEASDVSAGVDGQCANSSASNCDGMDPVSPKTWSLSPVTTENSTQQSVSATCAPPAFCTIRHAGSRPTGTRQEFFLLCRLLPVPFVAFCVAYGDFLYGRALFIAKVACLTLTVFVTFAHLRALFSLVSYLLCSFSVSSKPRHIPAVRLRNVRFSLRTFQSSLHSPYWKLRNIRSLPLRGFVWTVIVSLRMFALLSCLLVFLFVFIECDFGECISSQLQSFSSSFHKPFPRPYSCIRSSMDFFEQSQCHNS